MAQPHRQQQQHQRGRRSTPPPQQTAFTAAAAAAAAAHGTFITLVIATAAAFLLTTIPASCTAQSAFLSPALNGTAFSFMTTSWTITTVDDGRGGIIAGGFCLGIECPVVATSPEDLALVRLHANNGTVDWAFQGGSSVRDGLIGGRIGIATNSAMDAIYVAATIGGTDGTIGSFPVTSQGSFDVLITRLSLTTGAPLWALSFGNFLDDYGVGVLADGMHVYVSLIFSNGILIDTISLSAPSGQTAGVAFAKFDSDGNVIWATVLPGTRLSSAITMGYVGTTRAVYVASNQIYAFDANAQSIGPTIATANSQSIYRWTGQGTDGSMTGGSVTTVDFLSNGDIIVCGTSNSFNTNCGSDRFTNYGSQAYFVARVRNNGTCVWVTSGGMGSNTGCSSLLVDRATDTIYVTGFFDSLFVYDVSNTMPPVNRRQDFVLNIDPLDGTLIWRGIVDDTVNQLAGCPYFARSSLMQDATDRVLLRTGCVNATFLNHYFRGNSHFIPITTILEVASCGGAPDCAALNRLPCDDSLYAAVVFPNTCGVCVSGFAGSLEHANETCLPMPQEILDIGANELLIEQGWVNAGNKVPGEYTYFFVRASRADVIAAGESVVFVEVSADFTASGGVAPASLYMNQFVVGLLNEAPRPTSRPYRNYISEVSSVSPDGLYRMVLQPLGSVREVQFYVVGVVSTGNGTVTVSARAAYPLPDKVELGEVLVLAGILGGTLLVYLLLKCFYRRRDRKASAATPAVDVEALLVQILSILDFVTDVLFVESLASDSRVETERILGVFFVLLPFFVNVLLSVSIVFAQVKNASFRTWLQKNRSTSLGLILLSGSNVSSLRMMASRLFGLEALSSPIKASVVQRMDIFGFFSILLEDVPQLCLQYSVVTKTQRWSVIALYAVTFSIISILFGVVKRALEILLCRMDAKVAEDGVGKQLSVDVSELDMDSMAVTMGSDDTPSRHETCMVGGTGDSGNGGSRSGRRSVEFLKEELDRLRGANERLRQENERLRGGSDQ